MPHSEFTETENDDFDLTDTMGFNDMTDENPSQAEIEQEIIDRDRRDVFEDTIKPRLKAGDALTVTIWRDNEQLVSLKRDIPQSWEEVQERWSERGGTFKVAVRSAGKYRGQESRNLAPYEGHDSKTSNDSKNELGAILGFLKEQNDRNDDKMAGLLSNLQKQANENKSSQKEMMTTAIAALPALLSALRPQIPEQKDNSTEVMKMVIELQQKSDDKMMTLMDKMNDKFDRIVDKVTESVKSEPDQTFSPLNVMKMIEDAKRDAKDDVTTMYELIEKKAEIKALEQAESSGDESFTDKTLKALLPAIPQLIAANAGGGIAKPTPAPAAPNPRARRPLRQPPRANPNSKQAQANEATEVIRRNSNQSREVSRQEGSTSPAASLGLPTVGDVVPVETVETIEVVESATIDQKPSHKHDPLEFKGPMLEIATPVVIQYLANAGGTADCANHVLVLFRENNFPFKIVNEAFTAEELIALADEGGIIAIAEAQNQGDEARQWLREFYAELVTICTQ